MSRCIGRAVGRNTYHSSMKHQNILPSTKAIFFYTIKCSLSLFSLLLPSCLCLIGWGVMFPPSDWIKFKQESAQTSYAVETFSLYQQSITLQLSLILAIFLWFSRLLHDWWTFFTEKDEEKIFNANRNVCLSLWDLDMLLFYINKYSQLPSMPIVINVISTEYCSPLKKWQWERKRWGSERGVERQK